MWLITTIPTHWNLATFAIRFTNYRVLNTYTFWNVMLS